MTQNRVSVAVSRVITAKHPGRLLFCLWGLILLENNGILNKELCPAGGMAYAADLKSAFCGFESRAGYHFLPHSLSETVNNAFCR